MAVKRLVNVRPQYLDSNTGVMANNYRMFFYAAGSSTKQNTYNSSTGVTPNSNPIVLNARGEPAVEIWVTVGLTYKIGLAIPGVDDPPASFVSIEDVVSGINDSSVTLDQWVASGATPTYVSGTSFTLAGDQTSAFHIGRRLKFTVTAGTVYGRISASTFAAVTTVTMVMDGSQALDSGLSAVLYGLLTNDVLSIPSRIASSAGADTYTATTGAVRLVTGDEYKIKIGNANTSATPTLNLDSLGAKTIVKDGASALVAGDMGANGEYTFRYNGTNMVLLNPKNQSTSPTVAIIRQTVLSGAVDTSGLPSFGGSTGTTTVTQTGGALIATNANGFGATGAVDNVASITNPSWTGLSTNGTMYLYMTFSGGVWTTASTTIVPVYQWGGTPSVTNNTLTFNIQAMTGYLGNGATAPQTNWVAVGEVTVAGGVVTVITWYALMGRYTSPFTATLPGVAVLTTYSHNIGADLVAGKLELECTTIDGGYAVGDRFTDSSLWTNYGGAIGPVQKFTTRLTCGFTTGNTTNFDFANKTTGAGVAITNASWKYRMRAGRDW